MNEDNKEKNIDFLSCPLDEVADIEKKNRKKKGIENKTIRRSGYKSNYRGRNSRFSRSKYKPYYKRNIVNKYSRGRNGYGRRDYYNKTGRYYYRTYKSGYRSFNNRKYSNNRIKTSKMGYIDKVRNRTRRIFKKKIQPARTIVTNGINSHKLSRPIKNYKNFNMSLYRKNRIYTLKDKRIKPNISSRSKIKPTKKTNEKNRNIGDGTKFKPFNKYLLSKIKIVTSLNKVPSALKEQKHTGVNLPESLNNSNIKKLD